MDGRGQTDSTAERETMLFYNVVRRQIEQFGNMPAFSRRRARVDVMPN